MMMLLPCVGHGCYQTPRILEAISDKRTLFDMPSPAGDIRIEGPLLCKIAITDGKRASDRSWKPCYAQLRGRALFLFKDKNNVSPTPFEDQPISIKSSIVDIAYDYTKKKNVFRLTTYNGSEYLFQADDHDAMLQWIRMIQDNNNPEEDKQGVASSDLIIRKAVQQQESTSVNRNSPQVAQKGKEKKTSTRSLRSKSPSSHSPASKPKKQLSEKDLMDPSGQKPKDTKTWKDRMAKKFKRYGSSSSASADMPETSESSEITGTFGVPLEACPCSSFSEYVPLVVEVCTKIVEERGLEYQGIYRVPGNTGAVNILQEELNRAVDYESLELESEKWMDVNVVGSLLKSFFRKLPEPLITEDLYQAMIAANRIPNQEKRMLKIKKLIHDLPEHNFETFRYIAEHLNRVSEKGDMNKMDGRNLAIVFGPTLIRTSDENMVTMVTDMSDQCRIVESIIANYKWFFSSWFEDVNVPVEEQTDTVPVSGMNQELIVKAENLGDRGRDVSVKDLMSSVIQAANRKIRKKDKPKTSDSVDIDMESEQNSYNERNIDKEIELRRGRDTSQNCLTKEGSVNLEHVTSTTTASSSVSVHESKSSLSLEYSGTKEPAHTSADLKTSVSSLAGMSTTRSGTSLNQVQEKDQWSPNDGSKNRAKQQAGLPIKHYPAYPRVDISSPQVDNSKPSLLKKYSYDELPREEWSHEDEDSARAEGRRDHDEVKKMYGLTQQTRQHLRRIEQETEALRQRERERRKNQEHAAKARQRIERELQKTRRELEEDHNVDEILLRGIGGSEKLPAYRQKYSDHATSAVDNHSVTSDYSTMSSTNTTQGSGPPTKRQMASSETAGTTSSARRRSADQCGSCRHDGVRTGRPADGPKPGEKFPASIGMRLDRSLARPISDDVLKIRKGSLDSLLDVYDRDLSHIDSDIDEDDVVKKDEGLLESIASADPQFRTLLAPAAGQKMATSCRLIGKDTKMEPSFPRNVSEGVKSFRDPTLHKASGESKVIGIASRFERIKSGDAKSIDKVMSSYKADGHTSGAIASGAVSAKSSTATSSCTHSNENQPAAGSRLGGASSGRLWSEQTGTPLEKVTAMSKQTAKPNSILRQGSSERSPDEYVAALRKSTEKLFGSGEDLIDLRSPEEETAEAQKGSSIADKTNSVTAHAEGDRKSRRRRRHTVGGSNDLENMKAMMAATHQYLNRGEVDKRSAWERLQPKSPVTDDARDLKSWCMQQRLRHVGSSPALFDPRLVPVSLDGPPMKRKGSVKSDDDKQPSCTGSSQSSTASSPSVRVQPNSFGFVSSI
ncbi:hypothetical protein LSH36_47g05017 [Paralvinella palmiformis]|uniref:Rho GTPase-activating protein 21 n=1 Tax=Paralvinella palmiformis TaxID=53620 RepID=A0AAD9NCW0_9ANNE|nr:hypothetical protein LSH36_47g05017 [Paralvinella palmiformis]